MGTTVDGIFWPPRCLGDANSPGPMGCHRVILRWLRCQLWPCAKKVVVPIMAPCQKGCGADYGPMPKKGGHVTDRLGIICIACSLSILYLGGRVVRVRSWLSPRDRRIVEGHTLVRSWQWPRTNRWGVPYVQAHFWAVFPLYPGLRQYPVSSSTENPMSLWVTLGEGWGNTQD